jgi:hypothetical protein
MINYGKNIFATIRNKTTIIKGKKEAMKVLCGIASLHPDVANPRRFQTMVRPLMHWKQSTPG